MSYSVLATQSTPALIVYLLDISGSMSLPMGEKRRIDVVASCLSGAIKQMVFRSTKGSRLSSRYRIALLAYSDDVYDILDGIKGIDQIAQYGLPELTPMKFTETAKAFEQVEKLLISELPNIQHCPAPLVCHMTDGISTGADPEPVVERIKQLSTLDGHVLVENIYIADSILEKPISNPRHWNGILPDTILTEEFAEKLRRMSSPIPDSYRDMMIESGYSIGKGAIMMLPGTSPELISLGFQMSAATLAR